MFGGIRGRSTSLACATALIAAVAAGCGGGDDDDEGEPRQATKVAAVSEPADVFIERMTKLLETTRAKAECAQLEGINGRSFVRFPCPPAKALRTSMASFELVGAEEYGTAAVVDYKSGKVDDGASIVLFVAPDRNWGVSRFGVITEPSVGTSDEESRAGYEKAADEYLAAVRKRDCQAFQDVAFVSDLKGKDVCATAFAGTKDLAKRLEANPSASPSYQGGNDTYGFFTLETRKPEPENSTISVIKAATGDSYIVLDVAPSPTAAEQRRVREQFERQQKKNDQPERSPSRKVS